VSRQAGRLGALAGLVLLGVALSVAFAPLAGAQTPGAPPADSSRAAPVGTEPVVAPPVVSTPTVTAGPVAIPIVRDSSFSSSRSLRRSLMLPGWGQVTNGQTVKAPFIAAALVGAAGVLVYQQRRYTLYRRSALYAGCRESPGRDVCTDAPAAMDEWEATGSPSFAAAAATRDQTRGRRDISALAVGVVYALQAIDAYVAAELIDFDVSEDVAVRAVPGGLALRVRL